MSKGVYDMGWKFILDKQVGLEKYAGPDHWNDPDMLEVGNKGLSLAESRAHFSLWCMLAAPLMAGNDVRSMSPEIGEILTDPELIAIDQDPLGKQGFRFADHPGKEIWVKELSEGGWCVCLFNSGENRMELRVNWDYLPFPRGLYSIRDLWGKKDCGRSDAAFAREIPSHDVVVLKLTPVKK